NGSGRLLTLQVTPASTDVPWDVLEEVDPVTGSAVLFAYQTNDSITHVSVVPQALVRDAVYTVTSLDAGVIATASGTALMASGIDIVQTAASRAHVLVLTAARSGAADQQSGQKDERAAENHLDRCRTERRFHVVVTDVADCGELHGDDQR